MQCRHDRTLTQVTKNKQLTKQGMDNTCDHSKTGGNRECRLQRYSLGDLASLLTG
jgi:hypothetical protein